MWDPSSQNQHLYMHLKNEHYTYPFGQVSLLNLSVNSKISTFSGKDTNVARVETKCINLSLQTFQSFCFSHYRK